MVTPRSVNGGRGLGQGLIQGFDLRQDRIYPNHIMDHSTPTKKFSDSVPVQFLNEAGKGQLAYRLIEGKWPTLLWLGGFRSDMKGTKIEALATLCERTQQRFLCFDYFAHGETGGDWAEARIGIWLENALTVLDQLTQGPVVIMGSSMGVAFVSFVKTPTASCQSSGAHRAGG